MESKTGAHLKDREKHPKAKACATPLGKFKSAALAAKAHGLSRQRVAVLCAQENKPEWRYEAQAAE